MYDKLSQLLFMKKVQRQAPEGLTNKQIRAEVIRIAWPAITELFLIQLCSMVDTMMVGRLGPWALASVGYCVQPRFLLLAVFIALNTGSTALVARARGEGNVTRANTVMRHCLTMTFTLSVIVSVVGFIFSKQLVMFMGAADEQTIPAATAYMQIQMAGFAISAMTMAVTASLRGVGQTKISMVYNMVSNIVNVIFNYLLIYGIWFFPRLEVAGASIATVFGQFIAFLMAMHVIIKGKSYLRLNLKHIANIDTTIIKQILKIGMPAMGEQLIMRAGMVIYVLTVTALGPVKYATHQIASSILTMSFMNGQAFGISATTLLGQSLGKGRKDYADAYTYECRRLAMYFSVLLALVFFFGGYPLAFLYTNDMEVIRECSKILMVVAFLQPLQSSQLVISGALRGAGDTRTVAVITFVGILVIRPLLSYISVRFLGLGLMGAWMAMSIDQSCRSLFSYLRFKSGKWSILKV